MKLPEVRTSLVELSQDNRLPEELSVKLKWLASEISRRSPTKRAAPRSTRVTPELKSQIRDYAHKHPMLSQSEIGNKFNVNPGRVSEALRGFRH